MLVVGCHDGVSPRDEAQDCPVYYLMGTHWLGTLFVLTALSSHVGMVPQGPVARRETQWRVSRQGNAEPAAYALENRSQPGKRLEHSLEFAPQSDATEQRWILVPLAPELQAELPLYMVHPTGQLEYALDSTRDPPYPLQLTLTQTDSGQRWWFKAVKVCGDEDAP